MLQNSSTASSALLTCSDNLLVLVEKLFVIKQILSQSLKKNADFYF